MKIAIISDIHDNAHNLVLALKQIETYHVDEIIFLGDFCGAAVAKILSTLPIKVHAIRGNNDGDKSAITKFCYLPGSNLNMGFDVFDRIEKDGKKIFLSHYPLLAKPMAKSQEFDAVFYGHNHLKHKEKIGKCLVINPGEISAYKTGIASFAIYDTQNNDAEIITIKDAITTNTPYSQQLFKDIGFDFNATVSHHY